MSVYTHRIQMFITGGNSMRIISTLKRLGGKVSFWSLFAYVSINSAFASTTQAMPWEGPLQKIMVSISGPVAKIIGVIVIVIAGLGIAFGESGTGVRRMFQVVLGLAIAFTAASIIATLYNQPATPVA